MRDENLKRRTKKFALDIINLVESLPAGKTCDILGRQLLRAGTSADANYRAACRAKSPADFISKLGTVEEEADESVYWLELLVESGKLKLDRAASHLKEGNELLAIMIAPINTTRKNNTKDSRKPVAPIPHSALRTPH